MNEKDYDFIMRLLRELTLYVYECKQKDTSHENEKALSKRLFNFQNIPPDERERFARENIFSAPLPGTVAPMRNIVDSQLNNEKNQIEFLKGDEDLIKLKHGCGTLRIRTRIGKKGNLYKIYEGRYYNEFGQFRSVYGKTQAECVKKLKEALKFKHKGEKIKTLILEEWIKTWYKEFKAPNLRPSSARNMESQINYHIIPHIGKKKLSELTGETLQKFFNNIEGGNIRKKVYCTLNECLNKAVVLKKTVSNECSAVVLKKYKKQARRPITYEEQNKIFGVGMNKHVQALFFLSATGLRVGEFLALKKSDFFFDEQFFKVDKAISAGEEGRTKTDSSERIVYFTPKLFDYFNLDLLGTFTYAGLRMGIDRLFKNLGIKGLSLHSTRHTFASICHSLGMNDKVLQNQLGHSTLAMTQDTYTHLLRKGTSNLYLYLQDYLTYICTRF